MNSNKNIKYVFVFQKKRSILFQDKLLCYIYIYIYICKEILCIMCTYIHIQIRISNIEGNRRVFEKKIVSKFKVLSIGLKLYKIIILLSTY